MKKIALNISMLIIAAMAMIATSFAFESDIAQGEETKTATSSRRSKVETLEEGEKAAPNTRRVVKEEKETVIIKTEETVEPAETTEETMSDEEILDAMDDGALENEVELTEDEAEDILEGDEEGGSGMLWLILGVAVVVIIIAVVSSKKKK